MSPSQRSIPSYLFGTAIPSVCICIRNIQYVTSLASAFLLSNVSPTKQDPCSAPHQGCCPEQCLPRGINTHLVGGFHTTLGAQAGGSLPTAEASPKPGFAPQALRQQDGLGEPSGPQEIPPPSRQKMLGTISHHFATSSNRQRDRFTTND